MPARAQESLRRAIVRSVAILGLGLMGGSLGLALKRRGGGVVRGYARRPATRRRALARGVADRVFDQPEAAVEGADIVVFCVPVLSIPALAKACLPALADRCVATDVGSTKADLVSRMARLFARSGACFVGSHPIAGSEETGIEAARADLYEGSLVIVTPDGANSRGRQGRSARMAVRRLWEGVGARVVEMPPREHDRVIARTSHLPHMVAAALVAAVCDGACRSVRRFCGTGFRDTTRIAAGSEDLWHDIVATNSPAISREIGSFQKKLANLKTLIDAADFDGVRRFLASSRQARQSL